MSAPLLARATAACGDGISWPGTVVIVAVLGLTAFCTWMALR